MSNVIDLQTRKQERYADLANAILQLAEQALGEGLPYAVVMGTLTFVREKVKTEAIAAGKGSRARTDQ